MQDRDEPISKTSVLIFKSRKEILRRFGGTYGHSLYAALRPDILNIAVRPFLSFESIIVRRLLSCIR